MTKGESLCTEILLPLSTMLANGEILFMSNNNVYRDETENWIQVHAFYQYRGLLYAVTKDFAGLFQYVQYQPGNPFVGCRSYHLTDGNIIINIKGEVVATCANHCWKLIPSGTTLAEFTRDVQSQQNTNETGNKDGDQCHESNLHPPQRRTLNGVYQWLRRVCPNKNPAGV